MSTVQLQNIHSLLFVSFSPVSVLPGAVSARANFTPEFMGNKAMVKPWVRLVLPAAAALFA